MRMRRVLASLLLGTAALAGGVTVDSAQVTGQGASQPNIVVVLTDDQRWDTLWAMPSLQRHLLAKGTNFRNAFVVNPLCCPSRASILTGLYSHSTGIWTNSSPHGGFAAFDDSATIATALDGLGYRTAFIGKYLNGYDGVTIPPGWDRWVAFQPAPGFFDYRLNVDGGIVSFGDAETDYSTDVLADEARSFVLSTAAADPLFLFLSLYAPHIPATPAPRHEDVFANLPKWRPPSYNEKDVSDKAKWLRKTRRWGSRKKNSVDRLRAKQYRSLLAVDDAVDAVVDALTASGRLGETMIVFLSDNGYLWGEHRLRGKFVPYNESIRVPFVVRYDALGAGAQTESRIALNIDVTPTLAEVAGVSLPITDGRSLMPLLRGEDVAWRRAFLVDHVKTKPGNAPTYCAIRTPRRLFVRWRSGEEEFYKLASDPHELRSRAGKKWARKTVNRLRQRARARCQPLPPGMPSF